MALIQLTEGDGSAVYVSTDQIVIVRPYQRGSDQHSLITTTAQNLKSGSTTIEVRESPPDVAAKVNNADKG